MIPMKTLRYVSYLALGIAVAGCASNPASVPNSKLPVPGPVVKKPADKTPGADTNAVPERIAAAPERATPKTPPVPDAVPAPQTLSLIHI